MRERIPVNEDEFSFGERICSYGYVAASCIQQYCAAFVGLSALFLVGTIAEREQEDESIFAGLGPELLAIGTVSLFLAARIGVKVKIFDVSRMRPAESMTSAVERIVYGRSASNDASHDLNNLAAEEQSRENLQGSAAEEQSRESLRGPCPSVVLGGFLETMGLSVGTFSAFLDNCADLSTLVAWCTDVVNKHHQSIYSLQGFVYILPFAVTAIDFFFGGSNAGYESLMNMYRYFRLDYQGLLPKLLRRVAGFVGTAFIRVAGSLSEWSSCFVNMVAVVPPGVLCAGCSLGVRLLVAGGVMLLAAILSSIYGLAIYLYEGGVTEELLNDLIDPQRKHESPLPGIMRYTIERNILSKQSWIRLFELVLPTAYGFAAAGQPMVLMRYLLGGLSSYLKWPIIVTVSLFQIGFIGWGTRRARVQDVKRTVLLGYRPEENPKNPVPSSISNDMSSSSDHGFFSHRSSYGAVEQDENLEDLGYSDLCLGSVGN